MKYTITIQRFKQNGKYYDEIGFKPDAAFIYEIVGEIKRAIEDGSLVEEFVYLITGEGYPDAYPQLIFPVFEEFKNENIKNAEKCHRI